MSERNGWTPAETPPDDDRVVLVVQGGRSPREIKYLSFCRYERGEWHGGIGSNTVSFWRDLPPLPQVPPAAETKETA